MDSGNSGSMQSSSGDEEYDSRPESSLPAFLNHSSHFGLPLSLNPQSFLSHHHHHHQQQQQHQHPTPFDPSPNLFHAFSQSSPNPNLNSSLLNLDVVRPRGLRSDPDCTDLRSNLPGSSSSSATAPAAAPSGQSSVLGAQGSGQGAPLPSMQLRSVQDNGGRCSSPSDQTHVVTRNPKKRTRASRRAPTTVLTTDTSNFRAMVQEFTGIPAPPFSGSPYSRCRLDLFGSVGSGMRSSHLEQMGSLYPLHPSAQKVQHQQSPFSFSSSSSLLNTNTMVDATNIASTTTTTNDNNTITSSSIPAGTTSTFNPSSINNYQLPSDLGQLSKQPQNMLNMQNQMLSFQSLLQPPPLHHSSLNVHGLGAKSQASMPLPSLDDLGMSHNANLSGIPSHNVTTAEGMRLRNNDHNNSCKFNYSASSSDFHHHDKGLEIVPPRGEGAVDSWICPSE
ncbi:rho GTPase-activating protein gacF [Ricinus communis]|uniref:VQ domain-containing protein n=1 Tax=Ricinus communis TaxID=3988 RepID=B9RJI7_RICCO|nr:rho GTPase-activating protein gacF [Ricinus communis]EEF48489.1 conserved hypothetical protein [Ricinus communis]|eukprot:XP_002513906.1 rho GTPase-activating protein gacF [Ricinus communis]